MRNRAQQVSPKILSFLLYAAVLLTMLLAAAAVATPPQLPPHTIKMPLTIRPQIQPKSRDSRDRLTKPAKKVQPPMVAGIY